MAAEATASAQPRYSWELGPRQLYRDACLLGSSLQEHWTGVSWSPDGLALAATASNCQVHVWHTPQDTFTRSASEASTAPSTRPSDTLAAPCITIKEGAEINAAAWHPQSSFATPEWCCFATASRKTPIHLWDTVTGKLRSSYTVLQGQEDIVGANSLCFGVGDWNMYAGHSREISVFDLSRPGAAVESWATTPTRRTPEGQKGRISALASCPDASGLLLAGSTSGDLFVYDGRGGGGALLGWEAARRSSAGGHHFTGITHVVWSPDAQLVYSGARLDDSIRQWDVRNTARVLRTFCRPAASQQRITFDLDFTGTFLITGASSPGLSVFDTRSGEGVLATGGACCDPTNSVAMHPCGIVFATATGCRRPALDLSSDSDDTVAPTREAGQAAAQSAGDRNVVSIWGTPGNEERQGESGGPTPSKRPRTE